MGGHMNKLILFAASSVLAFNVYAESKYKARTFNIDPAHSKVGFDIAHLVISSVEGSFRTVDGAIDLSDKFEKSKVKASVEIASLDTGTAKRDDHLKGPDFFDAAK